MARCRFQLRLLQHIHHLPSGGEVLLGRGEGCHIVLDGDLVSREHARIDVSDEEAVLYDMDALNGTYVNDCRVTEPTILSHGDRLRIAFFDLTFESVVQRESSPPTLRLIYCPACQSALTSNMRFCVHCGNEVQKTAQPGCPNCGMAVPSGIFFCANCGYEVAELPNLLDEPGDDDG